MWLWFKGGVDIFWFITENHCGPARLKSWTVSPGTGSFLKAVMWMGLKISSGLQENIWIRLSSTESRPESKHAGFVLPRFLILVVERKRQTRRTSRKVTRRFRRSFSQTDVASKWLRVVFSVQGREAGGEDGVNSTWVLLYPDWSWTGPLQLISHISVLEQNRSIRNISADLWAGWIAFFKWVPILNSGRCEM